MKKNSLNTHLFINQSLYFDFKNVRTIEKIKNGFFVSLNENEEFKFMRIEFKEIIGGNLDFTLLDPLLSKNYVEKIVDANDKLLKRAGNYRYESLRTIENKYTLCIVKDDFIQNNRYLFTILGDDCEYYGLITTSHTDKNFINMIADAFSAKINNVDNAYNNYTINSDFKIKKYKNSNVLENGFATGTPKVWPLGLNEDNFHLYDGVFFQVDTVSEKSKETFIFEDYIDLNDRNHGTVYSIINDEVHVYYHLDEWQNTVEAEGDIITNGHVYAFSAGFSNTNYELASQEIYNILKNIELV